MGQSLGVVFFGQLFTCIDFEEVQSSGAGLSEGLRHFVALARRGREGSMPESMLPRKNKSTREGAAAIAAAGRPRQASSTSRKSTKCQMRVRLARTNLTVERLSLNRSQCGGCSTKYDTPTDELGRLRMILHRCIASGGHHLRPAAASLPAARG
jgi:hypothetical protein